MDNMQDIMTIEEVARYLRVSERTVYEWAQKGKIPAGKLGTVWRFKREDVVKWIDRQLGSSDIFSNDSKPVMLNMLLSPDKIIVREKAYKREILYSLIDIISTTGEVTSKEELTEAILKREALMSTGIGLGIAIPHVRLPSVENIVMGSALVKNGIPDYESLDNIPVKLVFMIVARDDQHAEHLKLVSQLSLRLKNENRRNFVCDSKDSTNFYERMLKYAN